MYNMLKRRPHTDKNIDIFIIGVLEYFTVMVALSDLLSEIDKKPVFIFKC